MMNKLLLSLLFSSTLCFAGIINGVALTVNDDPVTLYDIDQTMQVNKISKNEAVALLVDKALYEQLVRKYNISVDVFDVNNYVEKLAKTNGMDVYAFKSIIRQKYKDYSLFEAEAKKVVTRQKLIEKILKGQLKIANEEDMKLYYDNNAHKFSAAQTVELVKYTSKNKKALLNTIRNPLVVSSEVERETVILDTAGQNPQMQYLLNGTKVNTFTPVFTADKMYTSLFILKKEGSTTLSYDSVKGKIFSDIMSLREKKYLKEYFEKQKLTADIKIIR